MKLPRDFVVGVWSSLVAGLILACMAFLSNVVAHSQYDDRLLPAVLICLYAVLVIGTVYVFASRRTSQFDPQIRIPRFCIRAKLTTIVVLALGVGPLVWAFVPYSIPSLKIQVRNHSQYGVLFQDEAIFHILLPDSPVSQSIVDLGFCSLFWFPIPQQRDKPLVVARDEAADFECRILNPKAYRRYLEAEHMDVELVLVDNSGNNVSSVMHFSKHAVQEHWMIFELRQ